MRKTIVFMIILPLLLIACKPTATTQPVSEWQTFTNAEAGYTLQAPTAWVQAALPDQGNGSIHGMAYTGSEGGVEVYWGAAFGGACTTGTEMVKLAAGEVSACHATKSDGTEEWSQIAYQNSGIDYSLRAYTSNKQSTSHDLILQVLSTVNFIPTEASQQISEWQTFANTDVGYSLKAPTSWTEQALPDQNDGALHGMAYIGSEGGVEIYWGTGFGGACPTGTESIQLAIGTVPACHTTKADGTEEWAQIDYQVPEGNDFSVRAYTSNNLTSSHDLVLQVLSTMMFTTPQASQLGAGTANPASQYCIDQGGTLEIEDRGDLGQIGVCYFEDNYQCEEWALMRGDCPVGGVKVTGYATEAARYCAITGGTYAITGNSGAADEQGTCTFKDGSQCDAWDYYNGVCSPSGTTTPASGLAIQPLSMEVCNGMAQAMSHTLNDMIPTQSEEPLSDSVNNATGTGCQSTITGTGVDFESPSAVVSELESMLTDEGYMMDPLLGADGPTGHYMGYRKDNQLCYAGAMWTHDPKVNCPTDQPITVCPLTPEQKLYTVTLNCGEEVEASASSSGTALGGGGSQMVFDSNRGGDYRDLYLMSTEGMDLSRLTRGDSNNFAGPWSPDGKQIIFTSFGLTNSFIAAINADGSNQVTLDAVDGSDEAFPAWSPDGKLIAFTSRRDGNNEIYTMNADGSSAVRLTNSPTDDFSPSWSPDGKQIVFVSDRDQKLGIYDLYLMNADGSGVTHLTNDTFIDYSPAWSPDGKQIVFRSIRDGQSDIFVINIDGNGLTNLTNNAAEDWAPTWSPDGKYIAFQTNRDGNWEIYIMAADGSGPVNLTNDPGDDQLPYWQP
ncbi:MAG: hypothetical protein C3F13_11190 [Anaerolineales bacterium]|nr:MAG: hypothetical protein C3F13_11190 [Anaerolineales bacterium]